MGEKEVPADAYYGIQTVRAVENFPISGLRFSRAFIRALGLIKWAAALANQELKLLEPAKAEPVITAAGEVRDGKFDQEFVIDIFQTGSGTSTNMNANEVIANRATEICGGKRGDKMIHPNDHVNLGQSSNDVIPAAMHIAAVTEIGKKLKPALERLHTALLEKAMAFDGIVKIGRTHLQDATPIRLGQEFSGYARQVFLGVERLKSSEERLCELALGGTAVGTGINTHPAFATQVIRHINVETGHTFTEAKNHFEAQAAKDAIVECSGVLKTVAVSLMKIANDIRWLGSGPRCGIGEIILKDTQPGSSIMPGKVNPVIAESVMQVAAQVIGADATITVGAIAGSNFELNVMMPVIAYNLLQSIELLTRAAENFTVRCVEHITANKERCEGMIEQSLAMCTAFAPVIGYDAAAKIAKESYTTGKTVRVVATEQKVLSERELTKLMDSFSMTHPNATERK